MANAKNLTRSRHMDDWSIDDLCAFFVELKMDAYCKFLYQNKYEHILLHFYVIIVSELILHSSGWMD